MGEIMFSVLAQNRRQGWKNFEKKTGEASSSPEVSIAGPQKMQHFP